MPFPQEYSNNAVSITQNNRYIAFTNQSDPQAPAFNAKSIFLANDGSNSLYYTIGSSIATLSSQILKSGESITISPQSDCQGIAMIAASGTSTTTGRLSAWR